MIKQGKEEYWKSR